MSKLQNASNLAEVVSAVVVAVSVGIAVMAYLRDIDTKRSEFTFQTANQYQAEHITAARTHLFEVVVREQSRFAPIKLSASDLNTYMAKKPEAEILGDERLMNALITVAGFFNGASDCVDAGLCDQVLMRDLLGVEAAGIHCVFSGVLGRVAELSNAEDIAYGLERLRAGSC